MREPICDSNRINVSRFDMLYVTEDTDSPVKSRICVSLVETPVLTVKPNVEFGLSSFHLTLNVERRLTGDKGKNPRSTGSEAII